MSKRSSGKFKRRKHDKYFTPYSPAIPMLLPFLPNKTEFCEPCAGNGLLIDHLRKHGHKCVDAYDIKPQRDDIKKGDARSLKLEKPCMFITNPPWTRELLHPIIDNLRRQRAAWLLFDADWAFCVQAEPYLKYCAKIVPVGRVSWMFNGTGGFDNCAWYLFTPYESDTIFHPRVKLKK